MVDFKSLWRSHSAHAPSAADDFDPFEERRR
jgi:hypothetical protein